MSRLTVSFFSVNVSFFLFIGILSSTFFGTHTYMIELLQAFLEHGIPESPEMVVALMQKVQIINYHSALFCSRFISLFSFHHFLAN